MRPESGQGNGLSKSLLPVFHGWHLKSVAMAWVVAVVAVAVAVAVAFEVAVAVAFQIPVERAVAAVPGADKVRRLFERSAA
jgi:hypothetical protein